MPDNMSANEYIGGTGPLTITGEALLSLRALPARLRPEGCFYTEDDSLPARPDPTAVYPIKPWWHSTRSGATYDNFINALSWTQGSADILCTWNDGDFFTGLRVRDGIVTRHTVIHALGDPE